WRRRGRRRQRCEGTTTAQRTRRHDRAIARSRPFGASDDWSCAGVVARAASSWSILNRDRPAELEGTSDCDDGAAFACRALYTRQGALTVPEATLYASARH